MTVASTNVIAGPIRGVDIVQILNKRRRRGRTIAKTDEKEERDK
jgi:hypothetical protein